MKYAILDEMFIATGFFSLEGSSSQGSWDIAFNKLQNMNQQTFNCYGEKWNITAKGAMGMVINVTVNRETIKVPFHELNGTMVHPQCGAVISWVWAPDHSDCTRAYAAMRTCGDISCIGQLESAAKSIIGEWKSIATDLVKIDNLGDKFWTALDEKGDSFFSIRWISTPYNQMVSVQQKGSDFFKLIGDVRGEMEAFNFFKDMYDHAKILKTYKLKLN